MRFLIVKTVQNQQHILAASASLKSAEKLQVREYPDCQVIAISSRKVSPAELEKIQKQNAMQDRIRARVERLTLKRQAERLAEIEAKCQAKNRGM